MVHCSFKIDEVRWSLVAMLGLAVLLIPVATLVSLEPRVEVYTEEQEDGSVQFYADNRHIIHVYVHVDTPQLINMAPDRDLPVSLGLAAGESRVPVFRLAPLTQQGRRGYSLQYRFAQGNPETARHDDDYLYLLPFRHGTKHRLSQGFQGRFSHVGENEYAVDFEMDIGTEIYAARGGTVAEVKEDSRIGGISSSYGDDANYILILHNDGSFGNYAHLQTDGAIVEPGDVVQSGELIGYSGNTGRSSGPHLHFDVRLPTFDGRMQSVPFLFRGQGSAPVEPEQGPFYYAFHPGGPEFDPELGSDLSLADFADYREPIPVSNDIDTRIEQIDLTFLVFVQNGFDSETEVELEFRLTGLDSEAGTTVRVSVPAASEVLATVLKPLAGASSIRYAYTIRYTP